MIFIYIAPVIWRDCFDNLKLIQMLPIFKTEDWPQRTLMYVTILRWQMILVSADFSSSTDVTCDIEIEFVILQILYQLIIMLLVFWLIQIRSMSGFAVLAYAMWNACKSISLVYVWVLLVWCVAVKQQEIDVMIPSSMWGQLYNS